MSQVISVEPREPSRGFGAPGRTASGHQRNFVLDAMRAIAVLLVIAYHVAPASVPAGYLGVDLFFVLSGYLITSSLLRRTAHLYVESGTRRARLKGFFGKFYLGRLRRLVPAAVLMLIVILPLTLLSHPDVRLHLGRQVAGALTATANWVQLAAGVSYFDQDQPQLLNHMWSLAIEEQFYLFWPIIIIGLSYIGVHTASKRVSLHRTVGVVGVIVAVLSGISMAVTYSLTQNFDQAYLNTLTHCFGLLLGAMVACIPRDLQLGRGLRFAVTAGSWALLAVGVVVLKEQTAITQLGGMFVFSVAAAGAVLMGTTGKQAHWQPRGLIAAGLRWTAERSYAMYLWHWPMVVLVASWMPDPNGGEVELPLLLARASLVVVVTFALSAVSYRWVEQPILKHGYRVWWAELKARVSRAAAWSWCSAVAILVILTLVAVATAPAKTEQQKRLEALAAQAQALDPEGPGMDDAPADEEPKPGSDEDPEKPADKDKPSDKDKPAESDKPGESEKPAESEKPDDKDKQSSGEKLKPAVSSQKVTFIGDSVTLASVPAIRQVYPKSPVQATVGMHIWDAPDVVRKLKAQGKLGEYVVLGLGTNSTFTPAQLGELLNIAGKNTKFILVMPYGDREWIPQARKSIAAFAKDNPERVRVAHWDQVAVNATDIASDGIHPGPESAMMWVNEVTKALNSF